MPKKQECENCFKVKGDELLAFIKKVLHEGNVRRIIIKDAKDKTYMEIPVAIGFLGVLAAPVLVAVSALAAMAGVFKVEVIRKGSAKSPTKKPAAKKPVAKKK
jgi:hypothetical protein